ncbi:putative C6 transcription factor [Rhexocercosporidium sp. MPI-PUGE-AT-0058]|nr:putative C6 transcription factor [Rhexocercosporidium sp. MPI-PUGE-AT-0058]
MSEKRGRSSACRNCRVRKRKCLPIPGEVSGCCQLCRDQTLPCSLTTSSKNRQIVPVNQKSPSVAPKPKPVTAISKQPDDPASLIPPKSVLNELVDIYFRLIHDGPHTLFHEPTFQALDFQISRLMFRFSTNEYFQGDPQGYARKYAATALELLQKEMVRPSLETVQGYILISQHLGGEGDPKAKHICTGLARLHCQSLRLWETEGLSLLEQEVRRRTYLSVVITGKWSSADMSIAPVRAEYPPENLLLLDEEDFLALRLKLPRHGIWTQMAKTIDLFREILDVILRLGTGRALATQIGEVNRLADRLDRWEHELPPVLKYSTENFEYFQGIEFGKTFLAMHIGYHHYRQLLYFPFLDPRNENRLAFECKKHAMMVSKIASQGGKLVYYIIGHILVVSSSVHLHTLLLGGGDVDKARVYLLSNFDILMKLKMYWPVIDSAVGRLRSFQNHCQLSPLKSFLLDDWMWKFLMEQSAVLGEERGMRNTAREPLVNDEDMSNDALVESALSWLLD